MEFKELSLREAAEFDRENGNANKQTGWGKICSKRAGENSRSQRRHQNFKNGVKSGRPSR